MKRVNEHGYPTWETKSHGHAGVDQRLNRDVVEISFGGCDLYDDPQPTPGTQGVILMNVLQYQGGDMTVDLEISLTAEDAEQIGMELIRRAEDLQNWKREQDR